MRKNTVPTVPINVRIPQDLKDRIDKKLHDPLYGEIKHGSLTALITDLLYAWAGNVSLDAILKDNHDGAKS